MTADNLFINPDLAPLLAGQDPFRFFAGLDGEVFRELEARRTYAATLAGRRYFIKYHRGTGAGEIIKNLLQGRMPVVSAKNEWRALQRLQELGVHVPTIAAYGKRGLLPQTCESFIVTEDVGTQLNLEDLTRDWATAAPPLADKVALINAVADISHTLHTHGICHRDFYICHFLVQGQDLTLIDLHRALVKDNLGSRWIIKDVGSLYFSAMAIGLTGRDLLRFVRRYARTSVKEALRDNGTFWARVRARASKLKARHG